MTNLHRCWGLWRRFDLNVFNYVTVYLGTTIPCRLHPADCRTVFSDIQNLNLLTWIGLA